jgi:hypothetical protein
MASISGVLSCFVKSTYKWKVTAKISGAYVPSNAPIYVMEIINSLFIWLV